MKIPPRYSTQHLCAYQAFGRAGFCQCHPVSCEAVAAQGQRREERGRPSLEAEVSWLQHDASQAAASESCACQCEASEVQVTRGISSGAGSQSRSVYREPHTAASRLGELFPVGGGQGRISGTGRLDTTQVALHPLASVETRLYPLQEPDETGTARGACVAIGHQRSWAVVELRRVAHE